MEICLKIFLCIWILGNTTFSSQLYGPWQINCLPQAITVKRILRKNKIKSTLYLGLRKSENPANLDALSAHPWLRSGKFYVTGGRGEDTHTVVAAFGDV